MSKPTPNDYIVYRARQWRESDRLVIGAAEGEKTAARQVHRVNTRYLRDAVDHAVRSCAPVIASPESNGSGEP